MVLFMGPAFSSDVIFAMAHSAYQITRIDIHLSLIWTDDSDYWNDVCNKLWDMAMDEVARQAITNERAQ